MDWVIAIPLLPALAFCVLLPLSRRLRNRLLWLPVGAMAASAALAIGAFASVWPGGSEEPVWGFSWQFLEVAGRPYSVGLALDPVAAVMLVVVTIVGTCVQVYSLGYMHKDEREGWYFAVLSLFTSAMLVLVLADNILLTFAMWELMGLCSYLLIGFWYELEAPRKASMKAFLTTRVGDIGFLVALFAIFGAAGTFEIAPMLASAPGWPHAAAVAVSAGLLWAAMGKSAQVPLHVWLPDAMAGPTPASALIHAATMVAAGVFVIAKMLPILELVPAVMTTMLVVGLVTTLAGGLLAAVQHDIKKVLAYSTISQLGLMFVALGAGSSFAAMWHLTTHAFFKSLTFLAAGVIIHAAHTQDMREMGGLAKFLPVTTVTFTIGAAALAGLVPTSGFFSKDEILNVLVEQQLWVPFALVVFGAVVTSFYVTRLWFRVFSGPTQSEHIHEGHKSMLGPMTVLAAITLVLGFFAHSFGTFLGDEVPPINLAVAGVSSVATLVGFSIGWWVYGRRSVVVNTRVWKQRFGVAYGALHQKLYFDTVYDAVFVRGYRVLSELLAIGDRRVLDGAVNGVGRGWIVLSGFTWRFDSAFIDGCVNGLGTLARRVGGSLRRIQTGRLQSYQRLVLAAVVALMVLLVLKGA